MTLLLRLSDHLSSPSKKKAFNQALFEEVAPTYAITTRVLSFGRDAVWKRHLVRALPDLPSPVCVDLACGTGDLIALLVHRYPQATVTGIDITPSMLDRARARFQNDGRVRFLLADMCETTLSDTSADIVTGGYALRNAPDLGSALTEIRRILKPGGHAAFLDFSKPANPLLQKIDLALLRIWGGFWGLVLHGNPEVYTYIPASLRRFPNAVELQEMLRRSGFEDIRSRKFFAGVMELVTFRKPA